MDAAAEDNDTAQHEAMQLAMMPAGYTLTVSSFTFSLAKPIDSASKPASSNANPPPGTIVIDDPYEVSLCTMLDDHGINFLTITKESSPLCTILPLFNHNKYVESIIDPGSQVVAMLEAACHALVLIYNPCIKLCMQSVNGEVDETLGLTRNIPMLVGVITLYIQIYIVWNPAYDVLLGQPFDIVSQSIVHNYSNKEQTITIHDPNTGETAMVPTFTCRMHLHTARLSLDFCDSRI